MKFMDVSTSGQVLICTFYIVAIILEIGCTIIAFLGKIGKKHIAFFIGLVLISSIQMFMMIELFYEIEWGVAITDFTLISARQNVLFTITLLVMMLAVSIFYGIKHYRGYKREISFNSIKEAFDTLPKAISIINQKGIPVLVNKQMFDLVYLITGKDFQSLDDITDLLNRKGRSEHVEYIHQERETPEEDGVLLKIQGKSIWQIKQKVFMFEGERYNEISASEITPIYNLSNQLQEKNRSLREQKEKQEKLLKDMIQSKKEEEILNLKIDTHSKFGKAILATQLFLDHSLKQKEGVNVCGELEGTSGNGSPFELWRDVIRTSEGLEPEHDENSSSSFHQLIDASQVFGCKIILDGELPKDDKISYLIVTAMREAITNAVRHAKADELRIRIRSTEYESKVEIEDNSNLQIESIKETGGLADLRKKIEKAGGSMQIICDTCVKLILFLPKHEP